MASLSLSRTKSIIAKTLARGRELELKPLAVCVLDAGGHLKAFERQDGAAPGRFAIARAKAQGAISLGTGSRALMHRAEAQGYFVLAAGAALDGALVPVPGGVLIRAKSGEIIGAVGVSGDSSDNDEAAAIRGIEAVGLIADPG